MIALRVCGVSSIRKDSVISRNSRDGAIPDFSRREGIVAGLGVPLAQPGTLVAFIDREPFEASKTDCDMGEKVGGEDIGARHLERGKRDDRGPDHRRRQRRARGMNRADEISEQRLVRSGSLRASVAFAMRV